MPHALPRKPTAARPRTKSFLTVGEAADKADVATSTIRAWINAEILKATRVVTRWRVDPQALDELLRGNPK